MYHTGRQKSGKEKLVCEEMTYVTMENGVFAKNHKTNTNKLNVSAVL